MRLFCVSVCQNSLCADLTPTDCFNALPRPYLSASCIAGRSSLAEITHRKASLKRPPIISRSIASRTQYAQDPVRSLTLLEAAAVQALTESSNV